MVDKTISQLTDGATALFDDEVPINRASLSSTDRNRKLTSEQVTRYRMMGHPRRGAQFYHDFFGNASGTPTTEAMGGSVTGAGAANTQIAGEAGHPGILQSATGTTAAGRAFFGANTSAILLGGGVWSYEAVLRVPILSTGAERFGYLNGLIQTFNNVNQVAGCYFTYDEGGVAAGSTALGNWQTVTAQATTPTFKDSGIPITAAQWYRLMFQVNAGGTQVDFYINDALVTSHTTNIPLAAGQEIGVASTLIKSIGTTSRTVDWDYFAVDCDLTSPR